MSDKLVEKIVKAAHMVLGDIAYFWIRHGCYRVINLNDTSETMIIECKTEKNFFRVHNVNMSDEYKYKALYLAEINKKVLLEK